MTNEQINQFMGDIMGCFSCMSEKDAWKIRLSREYTDTKVRYERLHAANVGRKMSDNTKPFEQPPYNVKEANLLERQEKVMREYLDILEMRMALADISF